jgi:hypothetical protein
MSDSPTKILDGIDAVIDRHFFSDKDIALGHSHVQKRSCNAFSKNAPKSFDGTALITAMYDHIENNLAKRPDGGTPSPKNWHLRSTGDHHRISPSSNNESAEVKLERAIVQEWHANWSYQMPVASGLFGGHSDKRRAVDLVFDHGDGHYDLVELKIKSDTPLYAAIEILGYGLIYLASRTDRAESLKYKAVDRPVLAANSITLCVLAPKCYYADSNLMWLQVAINDGLKRFSTPELKMDFRFEKFGGTWCDDLPHKALPETLVREPVWQ